VRGIFREFSRSSSIFLYLFRADPARNSTARYTCFAASVAAFSCSGVTVVTVTPNLSSSSCSSRAGSSPIIPPMYYSYHVNAVCVLVQIVTSGNIFPLDDQVVLSFCVGEVIGLGVADFETCRQYS
jgi:hypothetical protein